MHFSDPPGPSCTGFLAAVAAVAALAAASLLHRTRRRHSSSGESAQLVEVRGSQGTHLDFHSSCDDDAFDARRADPRSAECRWFLCRQDLKLEMRVLWCSWSDLACGRRV